MAERVVYLNGQYVAERDAKVSVLDRGFRWGDAVYDATRTFEARLFKLHEHVERFFRSLRYARIDPRLEKAAVAALCEEVVRRNEPARRAAEASRASTTSPPIWTMRRRSGSVPTGRRPTMAGSRGGSTRLNPSRPRWRREWARLT